MSRLPAFLQPVVGILVERVRRALSRRFALSLTLEGYCLVGAMMLIGLAALNTAAPLLYLMFSMMCAFFILSALLATNTIRGIDVTREFPRVWIARTPMPVRIRIRNEKLMTSSYSLRALDRLGDGEKTLLGAVFFDRIEPRGADSTQEYECLFLRRGIYKLAEVDIATRFPFGLIERVLTCRIGGEVLILPQSIQVDSAMQSARSELGEYETNRRGAGIGLYGLREYTPELPARDIHWKITARRGVLVAREYESEEKRRACVLLDNCVPSSQRTSASEAFERAIVLAVSVVEWLCTHDHEVELRTGSGLVGFGTGEAHLVRCRRALAELAMIDDGALARNLLSGSAPGVFTIPILMKPSSGTQPGSLPLSIMDFEKELGASFLPPKDTNQGATPLLEGGFRGTVKTA
ncbi:DUF58 domain-containing protein [bacterium]|nr:DUF58 domain-containing protein [bacterium]